VKSVSGLVLGKVIVLVVASIDAGVLIGGGASGARPISSRPK
jgi:hypothetical protein